MIQREIEWHFNPPSASHMGGVLERMVRSTRTILKALAREQLLTNEQLQTLMAEGERIMNDRPITPVISDPKDPPALIPTMLLLMESNSCIPSGVFVKENLMHNDGGGKYSISPQSFEEDGFASICLPCRLDRNG